ncbi:WXG100 family type VII secretion target [Phytohabitans flavus]|nr:WXG100 family type VII secretion target [Phytohabitans flavus]
MTISSDAPTTQNLLTAFAEAYSDAQNAQRAVMNTTDELTRTWSGNAAAEYRKGLGEWLEGLNQVMTALNTLSTKMAEFAKESAATEDNNMLEALGISATWT